MTSMPEPTFDVPGSVKGETDTAVASLIEAPKPVAVNVTNLEGNGEDMHGSNHESNGAGRTANDKAEDTDEDEAVVHDDTFKVFNSEWIRNNMSKHIKKTDFDNLGWRRNRRQAPEVVRDYARHEMIKATGIMSYVDHLEAKIRNLELRVTSATAAGNGADTEVHTLGRANSRASADTGSDLGTDSGLSDAGAEPSAGWIYTAERLKRFEDRFDGLREVPDEDDMPEHDSRGGGGHVFKIVKRYDKKKEHTKTEIYIKSPQIRQALRGAVHRAHSSFMSNLGAPEDLVIEYPYTVLYHNIKALKEVCEGLDDEPKKHVNVLLAFLESDNPEAYSALERLEAGTLEVIASDVQWILYKPGTRVYRKRKADWLAFEVDNTTVRPHYSDNRLSTELNLLCFKYEDAGKLNWHNDRIELPNFVDGDFRIDQLQYIPESHLPNSETVRKDLLDRGKEYCNYILGPRFRQYEGNAWPHSESSGPLRVIIDVCDPMQLRKVDDLDSYDRYDRYDRYDEAYRETRRNTVYKQGCHCESCEKLRRRKLSPGYSRVENAGLDNCTDIFVEPKDGVIVPDASVPPSDDAVMLCPATIEAYSLRMKDYQDVELRGLSHVDFETDAWDKLVVSKLHKRLVTSMVESYRSGNMTMKDLVRGKGQGLVILLHGSPGTGKTLTAECVAAHEKRPLYMITCGDLGVQAKVLEDKLRDAFMKATRWNAILLLDEADVFLQERDIRQLERNALVSVFLREIEYFDGILFLTTNRPGLLDEAFQSRIHLTLSLPDLEVNSQLKVWRLFLYGGRKQLTPEEIKMLVKVQELTVHDSLNGRQIRNHVITASALAAKEGSAVITESHITQVLDISREFAHYMENINAADARLRASQLGYRV